MHICIPIECMRPLSILALRRLDIARMVQFLRALRLELVRFLPSAHFSSVASSEQSFNKFMNNVKNLKHEIISLHFLRLYATSGVKVHFITNIILKLCNKMIPHKKYAFSKIIEKLVESGKCLRILDR